MPTKRKYGRKPSPPDKGDSRHLLRAVESQRTRRFWNSAPIVLDQGNKPHCVGYAAVHMLLSSPIRQAADPDALYKCCKLIDGDPEEGTWVRTVFQILKAAGAIKEYKWARSIKPLISTVLELGPVVVGTNWYEGMEEPVKGRISINKDDWIVGGHAWLIDGVDTKSEFFRLKNSWSKYWGDNGHARISFTDMKRLIKEDGEIALAVESDPYQELLAKYR